MKNLNSQIIEARKICETANKKLNDLVNKQNELPRLEKLANDLAISGHSETYIQSKLYATRTQNISIDDIAIITKEALNNKLSTNL